jgi:hypothetical protein
VTGSRSRERGSTESGSSTVPAAGSGSGGSRTGGWAGKKAEEKIWTGYVEDSRRESAIALRYRRRLAGWTG